MGVNIKGRLTNEQLRRGACGISYRAEQLAWIVLFERMPPTTPRQHQAFSNARIESALVNARTLAYFLGNEPKSGSDLHINHYSRELWTKPVGFDGLTKTIKKAASSHLAHASTGPKSVEPHPGQWPLHELAVVLVGALSDFVGGLVGMPSPSADLFQPAPPRTFLDLMANDPLRVPTPVSKHALVGALTTELQTYLGIRGDDKTLRHDPCDPSVVLPDE